MKVDKLKELIRTYFIIVFAFSGSICIITFNIAAYVDSLDNFISKYYREVFMLSLLSPVIYFVLLSKLPKSTDIFNKIYTLGNSVLSYASIWITTYIILTLAGILEVSYVTFCVTNIVMIIVILCLCEIKIKDVTAVSVSISALEILQIGTIPKFMSFISNKLISSVLKIKIELIVSIIVIDLGWNLVNRFILREEKYHVGLEMVESVVFLLYTIAIFDMKMRSLGSSVYNVAMDNIVFIIPFIVIILIIWSFKNIYDDYSRMLISVSVISIVYVVLYLISGKDEISFLRNCVVILGGTLTIINYSLSNTVISYTEKIQNDKKIFEEYKILITNTTILLGTLTGGIVYNSKKIYRFGMEYPF